MVDTTDGARRLPIQEWGFTSVQLVSNGCVKMRYRYINTALDIERCD